MKWFKHLTKASEDESMALLIEEFGPEGYGVLWIVMEKIASQVKKDEVFLKYSAKKWAGFCSISSKKFQKIVKWLANPENFRSGKPIFSVKISGKFIEIGCPKLLKFRDEYSRKKSKKSRQTPDNNRTKSGECQDNVRSEYKEEEEKEKEKEKEKKGVLRTPKEKKTPKSVGSLSGASVARSARSGEGASSLPRCPYEKILELYKKHCSSALPIPRELTPTLKTSIRARWIEHPDLDWWDRYFRMVAESDFLMGRKTDWRASLSWLVGLKNMSKVLDGMYENNGNGVTRQSGNGHGNGNVTVFPFPQGSVGREYQDTCHAFGIAWTPKHQAMFEPDGTPRPGAKEYFLKLNKNVFEGI